MKTELSFDILKARIHTIRGCKVILDSDLALFLNTTVRSINQTVKRKKAYFPDEEFVFQLNEFEYRTLSQQVIVVSSKSKKGKHSKYLPNAFTELGVRILTSSLRSPYKSFVNQSITDAFLKLESVPESVIGNNTDTKLETIAHGLDRIALCLESKLDALISVLQHSSVALRQDSISLPAPVQPPHTHRQLQKKFIDNSYSAEVEDIIEKVASHFDLHPKDLKKVTRIKAVALPRQIAIYLIRERTQLGYQEIGNYFGGKDHTTVLHACRKIEMEAHRPGVVRDVVNTFLTPNHSLALRN